MKVRICTNNSDEHDIEIGEVKDYINILKENGVIDGEGNRYTVIDVVYDAHQHAIDIACDLAEEK